jgi:hypothetical protein
MGWLLREYCSLAFIIDCSSLVEGLMPRSYLFSMFLMGLTEPRKWVYGLWGGGGGPFWCGFSLIWLICYIFLSSTHWERERE